MTGKRYFLLTDALAMLPLVRPILIDVRQARASLASIARRLDRADAADPLELLQKQAAQAKLLRECLDEAKRLGIRISDGVRCEAYFPFEHKWTGPKGDGRVRPACFVYSDAGDGIHEWFFEGWPNDRKSIPRTWRRLFRVPQQSEASSSSCSAPSVRPSKPGFSSAPSA